MRLIDADALIEQMEADAEYIEEMLFKMAAYAAINDVKRQPTIDPQKWIPCSERLPENKGKYLTTYHPCYWDVVEDGLGMDVDTFQGKSSWAKRKHHRVIAWMPLPEAWRGEEDEKQLDHG